MTTAHKPLWGLFAIVVALSAVVLVSRAGRGEERIPWRSDFAAARAEARAAGKPLFLYFTASWCVPCQSLKSTTWADAGVDAALRAYVPVKIDFDEHPDVAQAYRVDTLPTFVLQASDDPDAPRRTSVGALSPSDFLAWLHRGK